MTTKKEHSKQTRLSIEDRVKILERLDNGEKAVSLAPEYKVSTSAIANIKRSKENLLKQRNSLIMCQGKTSKKRCTGVENSRLDQMLYEWYIAERDIGTHVTGPMLRKKALQLNKTLNGPETFKASAGFLNKFKERHDIVLIRAEKDVDEEQNSTVQDASDDSCQEMIDDNEKQENWEILDQQVNLPEQYEDDIDHEENEENEENEEVEMEIENKEYLDDSFDNDLTAKNAFNAINAYISWYQNQNYCSPEDWQYLWKFWKHSLNQTLLTKKI